MANDELRKELANSWEITMPLLMFGRYTQIRCKGCGENVTKIELNKTGNFMGIFQEISPCNLEIFNDFSRCFGMKMGK